MSRELTVDEIKALPEHTKQLPCGASVTYRGERGKDVYWVKVTLERFDKMIGDELSATYDERGCREKHTWFSGGVTTSMWELLAFQWMAISQFTASLYLNGVDVDSPEFKKALDEEAGVFRNEIAAAVGGPDVWQAQAQARAKEREHRETSRLRLRNWV